MLESEAEQGVAPVIVVLAAPRVHRRRYVTKRDLAKFGHTECQACTQLAAGMHNAKVPHDDRCGDLIGELMAEDGGPRQGERVSSRSLLEAEVPRPEDGEDMDVSEPTVRMSEPRARPLPTYPERVASRSVSRSRTAEARRGKETTRRSCKQMRKNNIFTMLSRCVPTKLTGRRCCMGCGRRSVRADADGGTVPELPCIQQDRSVREAWKNTQTMQGESKISTMTRPWNCG